MKTIELNELSAKGYKFPNNEPHFPIQVNAIRSSQGNEKVTSSAIIPYVASPVAIDYHQAKFESDIRRSLVENSKNIEILREGIDFRMDDIKRIIKHCTMMNNQVEQLVSLQNQLYERLFSEKKSACAITTRRGAMTQDPEYPEGHPKRIEQDALKKKKSSAGKSPNESEIIGNSEDQEKEVSISDAETEDNNEENEEELSQNNEDSPDIENEEVESATRDDPQSSRNKGKKKKPPPSSKGKDRDPWVQRPIPYPQEVMKTLDDERFNKFLELIKSLYLQVPPVDAIKMPPYSKYMKDIVTNKRKIPNEAIIAMLAEYSFSGKLPEKRGDPGIPTIPCCIKDTYVKYALCDLGAGVSVMPFSLYKKLNLNKLVPTEVSLQMADKSTATPIGICEDVPIMIANVPIPTDFVILEMPEDDNLSIILGRPFLNTAGAEINCTEGKLTFNVKGKEHTIHFPRKNNSVEINKSVNSIEVRTIMIGSIEIPLPAPPPKYDILMIGAIPIRMKVS